MCVLKLDQDKTQTRQKGILPVKNREDPRVRDEQVNKEKSIFLIPRSIDSDYLNVSFTLPKVLSGI